ncbi:hypothetical protein [Pseudohalioglobus lutimaris]|uniref:Uncharacterized protein n=1 Tax=Pseudohalioglobus lutimaris TaxID=1737061 RepID=A0A2N5X5U4_9GAMM|nr:hypothetical protein [Pseudohalioglobus lutimaris]PLW69859.1 hypothetical protein C0039_04820 [Pseudohalioglobus lutimaris]
MAFGIGAEAVARSARWWIYHKPSSPVINVLLMFGIVMGTLSAQVTQWGALQVTLIAFAIGYIYEIANFKWLCWWYFPDNKFLVFRGEQGCAISVACLWAAIPVSVDGVFRFLV